MTRATLSSKNAVVKLFYKTFRRVTLSDSESKVTLEHGKTREGRVDVVRSISKRLMTESCVRSTVGLSADLIGDSLVEPSSRKNKTTQS